MERIEMNDQCAKDVARICHGASDSMNTGEILRLMTLAWVAGYNARVKSEDDENEELMLAVAGARS
jgi:hypothetical protein